MWKSRRKTIETKSYDLCVKFHVGMTIDLDSHRERDKRDFDDAVRWEQFAPCSQNNRGVGSPPGCARSKFNYGRILVGNSVWMSEGTNGRKGRVWPQRVWCYYIVVKTCVVLIISWCFELQVRLCSQSNYRRISSHNHSNCKSSCHFNQRSGKPPAKTDFQAESSLVSQGKESRNC